MLNDHIGVIAYLLDHRFQLPGSPEPAALIARNSSVIKDQQSTSVMINAHASVARCTRGVLPGPDTAVSWIRSSGELA